MSSTVYLVSPPKSSNSFSMVLEENSIQQPKSLDNSTQVAAQITSTAQSNLGTAASQTPN